MSTEFLEDAGVAIFSIAFGILLPTADVATDVRLGVRLYQNGHPRWAACVLAPVFVNAFFTIFACIKLEKRYWYCYVPLVVFQIYPQFCVIRLMFRVYRGNLKNHDFLAERDSLDGGLGCLEPYFESVPQVFIQTAFFTIANSLTTTATRLCYNEKAQSCQSYDTCADLNKCSYLGYDSNHCNPIGYEPYQYKTSDEVLECEIKTKNCTDMFEACIQPFHNCLTNCTEKLTAHILEIDEYEFYQSYAGGNTKFKNDSLVLDFGATLEDVKKIQLYLLFIGDYSIFMSTYTISVVASTYGVTKFFRLSHARHTHKIFSSAYLLTSIITTLYLVAKGVCLAVFMLVYENEMYENVLWWLVFCMLPSLTFAFLVMFSRTCYKSKIQCRSYYSNYSFNIILKQPSLIAAPVITPFMYGLKADTRIDYEVIDIDNKMAKHSQNGYFEVNFNMTHVNNIFTVVFASAGLIVKAQMKMEVVISGAVGFLTLTAFLLILMMLINHKEKKKAENNFYEEETSLCIKHRSEKNTCIECMELYGFYVDKSYKNCMVCSAHYRKQPCWRCRKIKEEEQAKEEEEQVRARTVRREAEEQARLRIISFLQK